jgi:hypothetical protein
MAIKVRAIATTGSGTFTIPADFPVGGTLTVECVGAGGQGARGGGAYAKTDLVGVITANQTVYYQVGTPGFDTWLNRLAASAPASTANGALAKCGGDSSNVSAGSGGQASASIGDVKYSGGNGGINYINFPDGADVVGAGGGAAGPSGAGKNAGDSNYVGSGGGGGSNAGSSTNGSNSVFLGNGANGGAGGNGNGGTGSGAGGILSSSTPPVAGTNGGGGGGAYFNAFGAVVNGANGGIQSIWTDTTTSIVYGTCGGGGGTDTSNTNGSGGGAGNAAGARTGLIILSYNDSPVVATSTGNFLQFF